MKRSIEDRILQSLRKITRAIDLHSRWLASKHRLTGPQLVCLRYLREHDGSTAGTLANQVSLSQATVTGILDRLETRGLVTRQRDPKDKRRVNLALTPSGRELVAAAPNPLQDEFAERFSRLGQDEQTNIADTLDKIVEMMNAQDLPAASLLTAGPVATSATEVEEFLSTGEGGEESKG